MSENKDALYREEFKALSPLVQVKGMGFYDSVEWGYLAGRKASQEEIDKSNDKAVRDPHSDCMFAAIEYKKEIEKFKAKCQKLKRLMLFTDPVVENELCGGDIQLKQWLEFIKCFPDEGEENDTRK